MTLPTLLDLQRVICCPGGACVRPEACDKGQRNVAVDVPRAAQAVAALLCERWREYRTVGPMAIKRELEREHD